MSGSGRAADYSRNRFLHAIRQVEMCLVVILSNWDEVCYKVETAAKNPFDHVVGLLQDIFGKEGT